MTEAQTKEEPFQLVRIKNIRGGEEDDLVVKITCCSHRGPRFGTYHPQSDSEPSLISVLCNFTIPSDLPEHQTFKHCTYKMLVEHSYTENK